MDLAAFTGEVFAKATAWPPALVDRPRRPPRAHVEDRTIDHSARKLGTRRVTTVRGTGYRLEDLDTARPAPRNPA